MNISRRTFLRVAAQLIAFVPAAQVLAGRANATGQIGNMVVEHEIELRSLDEAIKQAPHPVLVPHYLPSGYTLERVGGFKAGASQVRAIILHYGRDAYHL